MMEILKKALVEQLFESYTELRFSALEEDLEDVQRLYGVLMGLRFSVLSLNRILVMPDEYEFEGTLTLQNLMQSKFSQMSLKEIRRYSFPDFGKGE